MPRQRRRANSDRRVDRGRPQKRIVILCEGAKTEPCYLREIQRLHRLTAVEVVGAGCEALGLVREARRRVGNRKDRPDEVWCVFDKDSLKDDDFDNAIAQCAASARLEAFWSNEAFELWFVLHFAYVDAAQPGPGEARAWYCRRLD